MHRESSSLLKARHSQDDNSCDQQRLLLGIHVITSLSLTKAQTAVVHAEEECMFWSWLKTRSVALHARHEVQIMPAYGMARQSRSFSTQGPSISEQCKDNASGNQQLLSDCSGTSE